ncbi:MAG TPA: hypothetical protein P5123_08660 [Spirochaetota bacterium]|nr:hypothetical protein [Spirochaetota bacterium]
MINWKRTFLLLFFLTVACNPLPKKDKYPDVPLFEEAVSDHNIFEKISSGSNQFEIVFLKDNRIMFLPVLSKYTSLQGILKISELNGHNIRSVNIEDGEPLYIDTEGNLHYKNTKYIYPDYKQTQAYETIIISDILRDKKRKLDELYKDDESKASKIFDEYQKELSNKYQIEPCESSLNSLFAGESCDLYFFHNDRLVIRQNQLYKNEFAKETKPLKEFDDPVITGYKGSGGDYGVPLPVYMRYYEIGDNIKFKEKDYPYPVQIKLNGDQFVYSARYGLYRVKLGR